jgi:hypothetical protein
MPLQTIPVPRLSLNEPLYYALAEFRRRMLEQHRISDWAVWIESIYSFNAANTDAESHSGHIDWVLMSAAMERLLKARSNANDLANRFVAQLLHADSVDASCASVLHEWAKNSTGFEMSSRMGNCNLSSLGCGTWSAI